MGARPLIGITAYVERARWGVWETEAVLLPAAYPEAVARAGGIPVVLPPGEPAAAARLDGLILAGGADIDPVRYGAEPHVQTVDLRPDRDAAEFPLLAAALDADTPVLGICRGMQVLAVASGGTLTQHLPETVGHDRHRPEPGVYGRHDVTVEPGTRLHGVLGGRATVPSYHHQGVATVGEGVRIAARADDGTVEAVELPGGRWAVGVLWHPEQDDDPRLFDALVAAASGGGAGG